MDVTATPERGRVMMNELYKNLEEAKNIDEMRKAIFRYSYDDPLTRNVMKAADIQGLSGEDRYVLLAYYALKDCHIMRQNIVDSEMLNPKQIFVKASNPERR